MAQELNINPIFKIPNVVLKIFSNKLAREVLLNNYPISPEKLQINNYSFVEADLNTVLKNLSQKSGA